VLVPAQPGQRVVVAFGDSITDGDGSTPEADHNWPNDLIRRLEKTAEASKVAVVNEGIIGNRLLADCFDEKVTCFAASGLARFDRDALAQPGVTHIVLEEGINQWIRTSGSFDGVIDFDSVLSAPEHPSKLSPRYASSDGLHPNDAGYQAVVDAIDLAVLK
jgi:lysophospholipase L1-like esterase